MNISKKEKIALLKAHEVLDIVLEDMQDNKHGFDLTREEEYIVSRTSYLRDGFRKLRNLVEEILEGGDAQLELTHKEREALLSSEEFLLALLENIANDFLDMDNLTDNEKNIFREEVYDAISAIRKLYALFLKLPLGIIKEVA